MRTVVYLGWLLVGCAHATDGVAHAPAHAPSGSRHHAARQYAHQGSHLHRFDDAEAWAERFEDPGRDAWQMPDRVLDALDLARDSRVADIGSATGYFPVRIARRLTGGRVWGVDIEPDMVRYLNARARREGLENLFSILGIATDPLLPEPVDLVLIVNTYHHIEQRQRYFGNLARYLRPSARIVVVDFKKGELPVGPPDAAKLDAAEVKAELEAAGYRMQAEHDFLPYQYLLVFSRP